jgi:very-short-patch-repair endonuclease
MILSLGYGRDGAGRLHYNFGPLNQQGGGRRLNVLVTRARQRCVVFSSFTDEDMDPAQSAAPGVRALRRYLAFARTGELEMPEVGARDEDSPFEDAVARALEGFGHIVHQQVGVAGYFIDIAISDPSARGRFVLGVECDGATYHSTRSARDRDRLRQAVLEGLGWRIHRIWSTDWFRDRKRCLERAEAAIAAALEAARGSEVALEGLSGASPASSGSATKVPAALSFRVERERARVWDRVAETVKPYELAPALRIRVPADGLHAVPAAQVADWVEHIVRAEGPVHVEDVLRRILDQTSTTRMGSRVRSALERGIGYAVRRGRVMHHGDALTIVGIDPRTVVPRDRSRLEPRHRDFQHVPLMELDAAIVTVVRRSQGILNEDLPPAVVRLLGFGRATQAMQETVSERVAVLLRAERLQRQGMHLVIAAA